MVVVVAAVAVAVAVVVAVAVALAVAGAVAVAVAIIASTTTMIMLSSRLTRTGLLIMLQTCIAAGRKKPCLLHVILLRPNLMHQEPGGVSTATPKNTNLNP